VLHLFAKDLKNPALAEEYCDFLYDYYADLPASGRGTRDGSEGMGAVASQHVPKILLCLPGSHAGPASGAQRGPAPKQPDVYLHLLQVPLSALDIVQANYLAARGCSYTFKSKE
jgi:hypothetical protein